MTIDEGRVQFAGAAAGIGSGLAKVFVGHGFDTVKTRIQCSPPGTYTSPIHVLKSTVRNEGFLALYKGITPPAVMWSAVDSLLFGALHNYRLQLVRLGVTEPTPHTSVSRLTLLGHGYAGLCAGLTRGGVSWSINPVCEPDPAKVKLQLQMQSSVSDRQFKGPVDCAIQIVRVKGLFGLWAGFSGSLLFRSNFFWMFLSFEALMRGFARFKDTPLEVSTGTANFLSGGLASFAFWVFAIPADNIKNRMMSHPFPRALNRSPTPSLRAVVGKIVQTEGPRGFFRGLTPSLIRAFPANACAIGVYEGAMRAFNAEETRH